MDIVAKFSSGGANGGGLGVPTATTFPGFPKLWHPVQMYMSWTAISGHTFFGSKKEDEHNGHMPLVGARGADWPSLPGDNPHPDWVFSSPPFDASSFSSVMCWIQGGMGSNADPAQGGFAGMAVTTETTASGYVGSQRRADNHEGNNRVTIDLSGLSGIHYLHLIDKNSGGWGWTLFPGCEFFQ